MQSGEEDGGVSFSDIGGLNEQIRELREVIELPLTNPELFIRVGIKVRREYLVQSCSCTSTYVVCGCGDHSHLIIQISNHF
jgi:SpoVK/Ycf46/Vps4 family AAA+-type ATPase